MTETDSFLNIIIASKDNPSIIANRVQFTNKNIVKARIIDGLNQVSTADLTLTGYYAKGLGGAEGFCEGLNMLPDSGRVSSEPNGTPHGYTRETHDPIGHFEQALANWQANHTDPSFTPTPPFIPVMGGVTLGTDERGYIYPFPEEGSYVYIFTPWDCIFNGTITHFERDDKTDQIRLFCQGIEVYALKDLNVVTRTPHPNALSGTIAQTIVPKPIGDGTAVTWAWDVETGLRLDYVLEAGTNYLMNLANLCTFSGWDWWITVNDDYTVYTIHCATHKGSESPVETWTVRTEALNLSRKKDLEQVVTSLLVSGSSQEVQNLQTSMTSNTSVTAQINTRETYLTVNISSTDTSITVEDGTYYENGNIVQIGTEKLTLVSHVGNVWQTTRATGGTTAAAHYIGDDVLQISNITSNDTNFNPAGETIAWIGAERITFTSSSATQILGLTRGTTPPGGTATKAYRHRPGTLITFGDDVEAGSPVDLYALRTRRESCIGATTMDTLDKYAGAVLGQINTLQENGTFQIRVSDMPDGLTVGDEFTLEEYDISGSAQHRITGLTYDFPQALVTIEYGLPIEYILQNFADASKAMALTAIPKSASKLGTILALSTDNKMAQVQPNDGSATRWVRLKI